jgi:chromosome segregation ATPase
MTPTDMRARADREERIYGQKDLAAMLRAGADAREECKRLKTDVRTYQEVVQDMTAEREALAVRLAEVEVERDKLEKQILKDRPLRQNTIDDATMWRFSVDMGEQTSTVVKIWEQRKEAISRAEAAEARVAALEAELARREAQVSSLLEARDDQEQRIKDLTDELAAATKIIELHDRAVNEARAAVGAVIEEAAKACDRRAGNASDFDRYTCRAAGMCAAEVAALRADVRTYQEIVKDMSDGGRQLIRMGDCRLVWAEEGDLYAAGTIIRTTP